MQSGPLLGIPFGVKDVIDVQGFETRLGLSEPVPPAQKDALCVTVLKAAGAVPIGKTRTTPYQLADPTVVQHPQHPDRTPGGSSVGSAVAVAAGHVPFALGAQTLGSILKPASFCGVVGYKPSYGTIATTGVFPLAPSLDHVGILARDVTTVIEVMQCFGISAPDETNVPSIGFDSEYFRAHFRDEVRQKYSSLICVLREGGAKASSVTTSVLDQIVPVGQTIHGFEGNLMLRGRDLQYPNVRAYVENGAKITQEQYHRAIIQRGLLRCDVDQLFEGVDVLVLPATDSPPTRETTGNSIPVSPSTFFGLPALSLPVRRFEDGTPFAVQCVGAPGRDRNLLAVCAWIETLIKSNRMLV